MNKAWALGLALLWTGAAHAQNAVTQNGTVIPGDVMQWARDRTAQDPGGIFGRTQTGIGLNPFSITDGKTLGVCSNSAPTVGPYSSLCFGHDTAGNGLISYNSFGGEPNHVLKAIINGSSYDFPIALPGTGVIGPNPSLLNQVAVWNNTNGTLLRDASSGQAFMTGTITGNKTAGNSTGDFGGNWSFAGVQVTGDTATNTQPASGIIAWDVVHAFGGAGAGDGSRVGIWSNLYATGPTPLGPHSFYSGIFSNVTSNFNHGGVGSNAAGALYGFAGQVSAGTGASSLYAVVGGEIDVGINSPYVGIVEGWGVASVPLSYGNPTTHGVLHDAGYGLWAGGSCGAGSLAGGSGCAGFDIGFSFGRSDSYFPISPTGTLIKTVEGVGTLANMKAIHGINFSNMTFSGYSLWLPHFQVLGSGPVVIDAPFAEIVLKDTLIPDNAGGRIRLVSNGAGAYCWQVNNSLAGDFSSSLNSFCVGTQANVEIGGHAFPDLRFQDSTVSNTGGGRGRLASNGNGAYCWQTNTDPVGNFATSTTAYCTGPNGDITLGPATTVSTTSVNGFVRINSVGGTPTGAPNAASNNSVPIVVDNVNNKLCYYLGAWRCL